MQKALSIMAAVAWLGCGDDGAPVTPDAAGNHDAPLDAAPMVTMMMVGPDGGDVDAGGGVTVSIPPGSVDTDTAVTVTVTTAPAPSEYAGASPLVEFGPAGIVFANPVQITLPAVGNPTNPAMYWSKRVGSGYERIGGTYANGVVTAEVTHFSSGFVASTTEATRTVQLTAVDTLLTATGFTLVPRNLSTTTFRVLVPNGTSYDVITAQGNSDGTASIPEVPDGFYFLQIGTATMYSGQTASALDIGIVTGGTGHSLATQVTPIVVNATNMTAWQASDSLVFYSVPANASYFIDPNDPDLINPPAVADTALTSFTFDSRFTAPFDPYLIKLGDAATMLHLSSKQSANSVPYVSVSEVFTTTMLDQVDGQTSTITSSFTTSGGTPSTLSLDYPVTTWESLAAGLAPSGVTLTPANATPHSFSLEAHPGGTGRCCVQNTLSFLSVEVGAGVDTVTGTMGYLVPGDATWGLFGFAASAYRACRVAPGASAQGCVNVVLRRLDPLAAIVGSPLQPNLGPVSNVQIDGAALTANLTGIALTPVVAWTAPALGAPTLYQVTVRIFPPGGGSQVVAQLRTDATSLRIPQGILASGKVYALTVHAFREPNTPRTDLFRTTLPASAAVMLTAFFST